ncbi:bifunctional methylenetetrahydrofolate dehydrogenase/methenyltetrahydrofolate cyclohydrolase FolD [Ensifer sp. 4252]|uniref:bifunctional methylenetetrahydrofolate dehydrogenase/methenyltetrahydrofolate cyclohydrolase FolD n=1 Tax=Ensifer sp. 4252 TaxID=3373915 RepID=UPI003D1DDFAA
MAKVIDGKTFARRLRNYITAQIAGLKEYQGEPPGLATVLVGSDPASEVYVRNKAKQTVDAGMVSFQYNLDAGTSEAALLQLIAELNADPRVHGILVQLPLPLHISTERVINAIEPAKDVDGFHISNVGLLGSGQKALVPCTPLGCMMMLRGQLGSLKGMHAVVIGRSNIVGKPMAQLLLADDCTVTIAHRHTLDLPNLCRQADILVVAVGRAEMVKSDWIKPGATVIDVGINRVEREGTARLVGDVDFKTVAVVADAITPVPGGVGPMTIACLLFNTWTAFCRRNGLPEPDENAFSLVDGIGVLNEFQRQAN